MRRYNLAWFFGVLGVAVVGVLLSLTPLGLNMEENFGLRWLFHLRGSVPSPSSVVVVAINDQTGAQLGLSKLPRNWPRSVHGRLVDTLVRHGASTIVFDFDFQTPKQADDDATFARSIENSGRVILTERLIGKRQPIFAADGQMKGGIWLEQLVLPIPILADAAKGLGTFPLPKIDVAVHQFWAFRRGVEYAPTIPSVALQIYAQDVFPSLLDLLKNAGVKEARNMPDRLRDSDRAMHIRELMLSLRQSFLERPQLQRQLYRLAEKNHNGLAINDSVKLKALIDLYAGSDNRYLNFYGPPGTITNIPYHVVLQEKEGRLPDLNGKVVFVGYSDIYDPGQPDRFYTVFTNREGVDLSGVEIAATAFANLLTTQSLSLPDNTLLIATLALFGVLVGGIALLLPAFLSVPLLFIFSALYVFMTAWAFSRHNVWLPLAVPMLIQGPLALFCGLLVQYLSERQKKKRATRAISFYLPAQLARDLTEKNMESNALGKVSYSVCFASDMAGFTTISEQLKPKELSAFLNDYFDSLSSPIRAHGVDVIEFRADGIMCAWTGENDQAAIRREAVLAALEAVDAISRFSQRHPLLEQPLRIGLETGMVYVGHSGGGGHYVYSIVGDCANTAARIEGLNKKMGTQILAGIETVKDLDGLLFRNLGDFQFVGKTEALPIVEIVSTYEKASEAQLQLCKRFEQAMTVFSAGRFDDAAALFDTLMGDYPDDGPSRFHAAYCKSQALKSVDSDRSVIIRLDSK